MNIKPESLLGSIVTDDFRAAAIFMEAGIDFCCGGKKSLEEACLEKKRDMSSLMEKLEELSFSPQEPGRNYKEWNPVFLFRYISQVHHTYVRKALPELLFLTNKIADVHGAHHPELTEVKDLFMQLNKELSEHLKMEDEVLFPAIEQAASTQSSSARSTIREEIGRMEGEHDFAGKTMDRIHELTNGYNIPSDACPTYSATLSLLRQFEDDLHIHVHLENNILFPKALTL